MTNLVVKLVPFQTKQVPCYHKIHFLLIPGDGWHCALCDFILLWLHLHFHPSDFFLWEKRRRRRLTRPKKKKLFVWILISFTVLLKKKERKPKQKRKSSCRCRCCCCCCCCARGRTSRWAASRRWSLKKKHTHTPALPSQVRILSDFQTSAAAFYFAISCSRQQTPCQARFVIYLQIENVNANKPNDAWNAAVSLLLFVVRFLA